jgi:hypothetical protein
MGRRLPCHRPCAAGLSKHRPATEHRLFRRARCPAVHDQDRHHASRAGLCLPKTDSAQPGTASWHTGQAPDSSQQGQPPDHHNQAHDPLSTSCGCHAGTPHRDPHPRVTGMGERPSSRHLERDVCDPCQLRLATAVSVGDTPSPKHNGTLARCARLSPPNGSSVAGHRPHHRKTDHPRAGGMQTSTVHQDSGRRQPVRYAMGSVCSTPRTTVGAEGVCGVSCSSPPPTAWGLPPLPTGAPGRCVSRTAPSGWHPPA